VGKFSAFAAAICRPATAASYNFLVKLRLDLDVAIATSLIAAGMSVMALPWLGAPALLAAGLVGAGAVAAALSHARRKPADAIPAFPPAVHDDSHRFSPAG
jgi:hypothetical protein